MNYLRQFQFNQEVTGDFIDHLKNHPESPEKVLKLMSHSINALQTWVARIKEEPCAFQVWEMHQLEDMHALNRSAHAKIQELLENGNLKHVYHYDNSQGMKYSNTLDEILTHLIIHTAHHRAQAAALWSQAGITPPASDFIFWARTR